MIVLPPDIIRKMVKNALTASFHLTAVGYYPHAASHHRERRHGSPQYIFLYCVDGRGTISLQGRDSELKPNRFFVIPKNTPHRYQSSVDAPWSIYWAHFTGDNADALYHRYQEQLPEDNFTPFDERRIAELNTIISLLENSFDERTMEAVNIRLFNLLSLFVYQADTNPRADDNDVISNSIGYMKANIGRNLSIDQLATQQKLSVSHYSRLFYKKEGLSPVRYFNRLKIQRSCQMLYFTDRSIKEICAELGFTDPYYFSRLFKKLMGISPAQYKSQQKR
ncbi:hypothetical protein BEL04_12755 [Mucilaginibacter sp. PPCGB 2223]|nr:hypothetical protein BEL04_12755 [Mucilaginibacter sp. PPCGB 2223]